MIGVELGKRKGRNSTFRKLSEAGTCIFRSFSPAAANVLHFEENHRQFLIKAKNGLFVLYFIYFGGHLPKCCDWSKKFFNKEQDSFLLLFCEHPQSLYFCYTDQQKRVEGSVFSCSVLLEKLAKF